MYRTHYCGELNSATIGKKVTLSGWVHSRRDHGGVIFIDLRDIKGLVQIVFNPGTDVFAIAEGLKSESVIKIEGTVRRRPEGTENPKIPTGEVEVVCDIVEVLNESAPLPFSLSEYIDVSEEVRLKYRYLDLRRPAVKENFIFRDKLISLTRDFFRSNGFLEIETPFLTKSTPEGARDFLVPSRLIPGSFYALPQSPQLFKQILMVAGFDRYYQIARCFRDEDLRADRQPEFTQLDIEMSFVEEDDVIDIIERFLSVIFENLVGEKIATPFARISYDDAMLKYGSDKPDTRFGLEIKDLTPELAGSKFKVFSDAVSKGGCIRAICVEKGAELSRSEIDGLIAKSVELGAKGLAWMKFTPKGFESSIVKFFSEQELEKIKNKTGAVAGDLLLFVADDKKIAASVLGQIRLHLAERLKLIGKGYKFLWVVDFNLLEWDATENKWSSIHHPFTSPKTNDIKHLSLENPNLAGIKARAYDIVLNGVELGGGSIRINKPQIQKKIFELLGISDDDAKTKFGFLIEALNYGAPPHGGIALGLDRLVALLRGETSIREVIAFPKTQKGVCPLTSAPTRVTDKQLKEIYIKTTVERLK